MSSYLTASFTSEAPSGHQIFSFMYCFLLNDLNPHVYPTKTHSTIRRVRSPAVTQSRTKQMVDFISRLYEPDGKNLWMWFLVLVWLWNHPTNYKSSLKSAFCVSATVLISQCFVVCFSTSPEAVSSLRFLIYNLVWIYLVLNAAPVRLLFVLDWVVTHMNPDVSCCRVQMVAGRQVKMKTCCVVSLRASGWWCHSMSSLMLFVRIIVNRLLRSSLQVPL